ncbi:MAG: hypothetical protein QOH50_223 [Kribbellaceae bacterium]|nr:hypothetical protein [Kribbellaceae bacterium]
MACLISSGISAFPSEAAQARSAASRQPSAAAANARGRGSRGSSSGRPNLRESSGARRSFVAAFLHMPGATGRSCGSRRWTSPTRPRSGAVVDAAFAALGRIDVVVSNAALLGAAEELADEEVLRQLDTKMVGSIQLGHAVIPHLREQGGGRILQPSGMGGQAAFPGMSPASMRPWSRRSPPSASTSRWSSQVVRGPTSPAGACP